MSFFYWFVNSIFKAMFSTLHRHKIYGAENLPEGPAIIAANHTSYYDPPIIGASSPVELHFLAKANLFRFPIFASIIRSLNAHPVSGTTSDLSSFKLICELIAKGHKVVIFPEGGRSKTGKLMPIKPGIGMLAMRCDAPIIPTYIEGLYNIWPMGQKFPKPWGKTSIKFGKPIDWHKYSHLNRKEAQQAIADEVASSLRTLSSDS